MWEGIVDEVSVFLNEEDANRNLEKWVQHHLKDQIEGSGIWIVDL